MLNKILSHLKFFFENLDRGRDRLLFLFIKPYWPRKITPNQLTVVRIIIGIALFILLFYYKNDSHILILTLFCIGAITDLLDGSVARALNEETKIGAMMDSIADRILLAPIAIYSLSGYPSLFWCLILLEIASFFISLYAESKHVFMKSNIFGKVKMVLQSIVFAGFLIIFTKPAAPLFIDALWVSAGFIILSIFAKIIELQNEINKTQAV